MRETMVAGFRMVRSGHTRERVRMMRDSLAALRVATAGAAVRTGVVDALAGQPRGVDALARHVGAADTALLEAFVRTLEATGVVREQLGRWTLSRRGRALHSDPVVRAAALAYGGYHTDLYRSLGVQLTGGAGRTDIADEGETIAQLSLGFQPFLEAMIRSAAERVAPERVLDVGCGAGRLLVAMLEAAPSEAVGIGIDSDADAVRLAQDAITTAGLAGRADVRQEAAETLAGSIQERGGPVDLLLLANVIYYVPLHERVAFLRMLAGMLRPGGTLLLVTTTAEADHFARHFDLLLRAQGLGMELPDVDELRAQAVAAGLDDIVARRLTPGLPLHALTAVRPAG